MLVTLFHAWRYDRQNYVSVRTGCAKEDLCEVLDEIFLTITLEDLGVIFERFGNDTGIQ